MKSIRLLYVVEEPWPTYRADVVSLFGKYLPRHGIASDIVTERDGAVPAAGGAWPGGEALLCGAAAGPAKRHVI
jgi:hypothetical protein